MGRYTKFILGCMSDFKDLWQEIYEYAKKLGVRPEQLFAYKILSDVERITDTNRTGSILKDR